MADPATSESTPTPPAPTSNSIADKVRNVALPVAIGIAALVFAGVVHKHYPIDHWLFWRYAEYWVFSLTWVLACVSSGNLIVTRILGHTLPFQERAVLSFSVGIYVFFVGMFTGGLLGLYGTAFFFALPLAMIAAGAKPLVRAVTRFVTHVRYRRARTTPSSPWALPIAVFGLIGVAMVYFTILSPKNISFDSRWQHLGLAEHYVAEGAVRRFPEGWFVGASPHLSSFVYTWAFLIPKGSLFDRVELSAHLEFASFLWTLVGIPALLRKLIPSLRKPAGPGQSRSLVGLSWVVRFLFPSIFVYDSCLSVGADHMAAVFAVPIFLLMLRAYKDLSPRICLVFTLMLSTAFLTKYTGALTLLGLPVLAILFRAAWLAIADIRRHVSTPAGEAKPAWGTWYLGPLVALGGGLAFTAPHWVKNWVFYGDPLYPMLAKRLHAHPWTPDSGPRFEWGFIKAELWRPTPDLDGVIESLKVLVTQSFIPNDWAHFHGKVPLFGSLFTLTLFFVPFLTKTKRIAVLFGAVHLGMLCWYWTHHQDRYLQTMLPWMATATAGVLMLIWRTNLVNRIAISGLVALQVVWGGDAYFIPSNAMDRNHLQSVIDLISSGYRKEEKSREAGLFSPYSDIGKALPPKAKLLVHQSHNHLGIEAPSVNDYTVNQGGISYGLLKTSRAVYDLYKGYGVTHIMYPLEVGQEADTLAGDFVFWGFSKRYGKAPKTIGGYVLTAMPDEPPPDEPNDVVAVLTCGNTPRAGLYHLPALHVPVFGPKKNQYPAPYKAANADKSGDADLVAAASFLVAEPKCRELPAGVHESFERAAAHKEREYWVRVRNTPVQ